MKNIKKIFLFLLILFYLASCGISNPKLLMLDKTFSSKLISFEYPSSFVPKVVENTVLLYRGNDVFIRFIEITQKDKDNPTNKALFEPNVEGTDVTSEKKTIDGIESDWIEATDYKMKRAAIIYSLPVKDMLVVIQTPSLLSLDGDYLQAKGIIESIKISTNPLSKNVDSIKNEKIKLLPGFGRIIKNKFFLMQVKNGWEADDYYQNNMAIIKKGFQGFTVIARPDAKVDAYLKSITSSYKNVKDVKESQSIAKIGENHYIRLTYKTQYSESTNLLLEKSYGLIQVICGGEFTKDMEEMVATITIK